MDKQKLNSLMQDLFEFEKINLHKSGIHQVTIDTIEKLEDELRTFGEEDYTLCTFEEFVGSWSYQIENILEVCKENLIDYSILNGLLKVLEKYE